MNENFFNLKDIGIPFYQKMYFERFKDFKSFENNAYMTVVAKKLPTQKQFEEIILPECEKQDNILITYSPYKERPSFKHSKLVYVDSHLNNFHSMFNKYIYFHCGYEDPHPRMFHECLYYGKDVFYNNQNSILDGGYYRYFDSIMHKLKNVTFSKEDEITKRVFNFNSIGIVHCYLPFVNGALFDAIEYFLWLYDHFGHSKDVKLFLVYSGLCNCLFSEEEMIKEIMRAIKDKYKNIEDNVLENICFLHNKTYLSKSQYRKECYLIIDNHSYPECYMFVKGHSKKILLTVDPYFPSRTDYAKLSSDAKIEIFNEIPNWGS